MFKVNKSSDAEPEPHHFGKGAAGASTLKFNVKKNIHACTNFKRNAG
jgi:hypothetical protein